MASQRRYQIQYPARDDKSPENSGSPLKFFSGDFFIWDFMKPCKKCGAIDKGKRGYCRPCQKVYNATYRAANSKKLKANRISYYIANSEKIKAGQKVYSAIYRAANPEKIKADRVAYYTANSEKIKAGAVAYYIANTEKIKARHAIDYAANSEKRKLYNRAYHLAHPEGVRIRKHNRRNHSGKLSQGLSDKLFKRQKGKCPCCHKLLGKDFHLDHIMPLALGGKNEDGNMQLLRATCNLKKSAKHPVNYMQERGFLL